jgi:hypothetical protein
VFAVVIIGLFGPKTGSKLGLSGPKRGHTLGCNTLNQGQIRVMGLKTGSESLNSCHIHQNWVFAVVIFGLYDPKTGSKLGLSGPKRCHKLGCNTLKPKPGSNLGYGPQNGVRNGLFTQKLIYGRLLGIWAFRYMGFSVYGLLGIGAFRYTGFSVVTP